MSQPTPDPHVLRTKVVLLAAQGLFLGLTAALLIVPTSAIFLGAYGSARLPYTYIAVAVLGALVSLRLAAVLSRVRLVAAAMVTTSSFAVIVATAWILLRTADATWTSFPLWVLFPLIIQLGFVFTGGQARRLLDIRQIKRFFPRVVFGFAIGFLIGGLITVPLASRLQTEDMLVMTVASAAVMTVLYAVTGRRFAAELADAGDDAGPAAESTPTGGWRRLLRDPYVIALFGYQTLSAAGSQIADFLAFDRAAARYSDTEQLAEFVGVYTAAMNIADIAFLAIVAGFLMSRFGLRFGLMANPAVVLALTAALLVVAPVAGAASTPFFFLAVTTRLLDIVFTDGTTRTSVNAAFQAVAPGDRLVVQTGVEGVGVPAALGAVGVLLLILDAVGAWTTAVAVAMAVVVAGWVCAGWIVFRGYRRNIAVRIRRRQIEPIEIGLDDPVTRGVVESLVASGDVVKLRAGLDLLADAGDDRLSEVVDGLLHDADPVRRAEGLSRLVGDPRRLRIEMAETLLADDAAQVRAAAARVVCAGGRAELAEALLEDPSLEVRVSSATALRLSGGGEIVESHLAAWAGDPDASIRQAAASVLAETLDVGDSEILLELCADAEPSVRDAALRAAELHPRADVLDALLSQTFPRSAGPGLVAVLAAGGTSVRHLVTAGLAAADQAPWGVPRWRLVRAVARFDPDSAFEVLGPYVDDADPVVRATVRRTLLDVGWEGSPGHSRLAEALASDTSRLVATLAALDAVATVDSEGLLARALRDAIADQTSAIALLADLTTGTTVASHARRMLESDSEGRRAMALESIEVTFGREMRRLLGAALTPGLSVGERLVQLGGTRSDVEATVGAILSGEGSGVDPWIRACAVQRRRDRRGDRVGRRSVVFGELTAGIRSAEPRPRGPHGRRCRR